ncbi:uncharacterized protein LOC124302618 [Neodiprion virginianus]|uniref:uncharacterized protein LOC124302618 n=1 Tax=Neodiprion virginianus TaxID=2961670 RepID=UPI001EE71E7C|nr:uncharacterized protein LOC124302618 [Neodiprion virginianus]
MQRFVLLAIVGFCLAAYATANDLRLGEREDGDVLVASRRLFRFPVPGKSMVAKSGFNTEGRITAVSAVNAPGKSATINVVKGGVGTRTIVVSAVGELGTGLDVQLDVYAVEDKAANAHNRVILF